MVGLGRLELPTSPLSGARSRHLSYRPIQRPLQNTYNYYTTCNLRILSWDTKPSLGYKVRQVFLPYHE